MDAHSRRGAGRAAGRRSARHVGLAAALALAAAAGSTAGAKPAAAPAAENAAGAQAWRFAVALDGRPIGTHEFVVQGPEANAGAAASAPAAADVRRVSATARFDVKVLGLSVYRYLHEVREQWQAGCLATLTARTDDDGTVTEVRGQAATAGGGFTIEVEGGSKGGRGGGSGDGSPSGGGSSTPAPARRSASGCVMSFAYWNPAILRQTRLLDPGSGRLEAVQISELPAATLPVRGRAQPVQGWRIAGLPQPIDVWYADGRWVGLDTTVQGGRRLSYRLN